MQSYEVTFEARPSYQLFMFANMSLSFAKSADNQDLQQYYLVTGIVHAAFAFESMINHFGKTLIGDWEDVIGSKIKGRANTDKYLFKCVGLIGLAGSKKYQTLKKYFELRDFFAHSKTTEETASVHIDEHTPDELKVDKLNSVTHSKMCQLSPDALAEFIELIEFFEHQIESKAHYPSFHIHAGEKISESPLGCSGLRTIKKR